MIKAEQIPDEVVEALCVERYAEFNWGRCSDEFKRMKKKEARAELAAGLAAWPGAEQTELCGGRSGPALILPLSQEGAADLNEGDDELLWRRD